MSRVKVRTRRSVLRLTPIGASYDVVSAYRVPPQTIAPGTSPFGLGSPDMIVTEEPTTGDIFPKVVATPEALDRWYAAVAVAAPASFVQGYREVPSGFDAGAIITLIGVGLTVAVAVGLSLASILVGPLAAGSARARGPRRADRRGRLRQHPLRTPNPRTPSPRVTSSPRPGRRSPARPVR